MDIASPPRYRRYTTSRHGPVPRSGDELPPYTQRNTLARPVARREPTEHVYLLTEKSRPFITLKLYSSATSSASLPTFFEKENINGTLEINAEKGDSISSITATITGRIITGAHADDSCKFLTQSIPIWSKSPDVPRVPSPSEGASKSKLLGRCEWPLSIPLPRTVTIPNESGSPHIYSLPETFLERHTAASIQYDFTIRISRGMLRIKTAFGYVPSTRPRQASLLRQLSYQQNTPLVGPSIDPEGWKTLRAVSARALMFRSRQVGVQCLLSLAKPLSYTRGSTLPCFLTLQSADEDILHLFATPSAPVLKLQRCVRFLSKTSLPVENMRGPWHETIEDIGSAVWWSSAGTDDQPSVRHLEGEIKLGKDLRPTTSIGHFSISYHVVLRPFDVPYSTSEDRSLLSEPVEITTMHAHGPRPQAYSPPAYTSPPPPDDHYLAVSSGGAGSPTGFCI
ncbi:hypothetical protein C0995_000016 [Termitomyces sp. Mi166|nr:hypothetical protein C0995_000016 [Termitomyces sp. Mi166\